MSVASVSMEAWRAEQAKKEAAAEAKRRKEAKAKAELAHTD